MKEWKNISGEDVSFTSRISQSLKLISSSQNGFRFELSSLQIFTQQNLSELFGTWTFLSLELPKHAKASSQCQTLVHAEASQEKIPNSLKKFDFMLK